MPRSSGRGRRGRGGPNVRSRPTRRSARRSSGTGSGAAVPVRGASRARPGDADPARGGTLSLPGSVARARVYATRPVTPAATRLALRSPCCAGRVHRYGGGGRRSRCAPLSVAPKRLVLKHERQGDGQSLENPVGSFVNAEHLGRFGENVRVGLVLVDRETVGARLRRRRGFRLRVGLPAFTHGAFLAGLHVYLVRLHGRHRLGAEARLVGHSPSPSSLARTARAA